MSLDRPKILLADDSVTIRKVVELTFADEGIDVVSVADGDSAMVSFVENQPDLVIADVNMPGVDGYKICEIIKQDESTHDIPVILLTGSFEPFDAGEASRVGANYYFTKPFQSIRGLVEKVTDLLDAKAFEPANVAETEDIDGLYKDSFADTQKVPAILTVADLGYEGMDDEIPAHQAAESTEHEATFPANLTVADLGYEGMDDEIPEHIIIEKPTRDAPAEQSDPFTVPVDLGDSGMDDEMIETSYPNESENGSLHTVDTLRFNTIKATVVDKPINPFASQVTTDETIAKFNWTDEAAAIVEQIDEPVVDSTLLKIEFADNDSDAIVDAADDNDAETPEPEAAVITPQSVSSELIEMIAQRVIEHLSDKVIREVAMEVVPKITEDMIREALEDESKNGIL